MLRYDFDDDLWVLKYDMRNRGIVIRFMDFIICLKMTWEIFDVIWCMCIIPRWICEMMKWAKHGTKSWTLDVIPFGLKSHRQLMCNTSWVKVSLASATRPFGLKSHRHNAT
jgi:hypothetical protein